jgi:hypothetical protein
LKTDIHLSLAGFSILAPSKTKRLTTNSWEAIQMPIGPAFQKLGMESGVEVPLLEK